MAGSSPCPTSRKAQTQGTEPLPGKPQEMAKWLAAEKERNAKLIQKTGFKLTD